MVLIIHRPPAHLSTLSRNRHIRHTTLMSASRSSMQSIRLILLNFLPVLKRISYILILKLQPIIILNFLPQQLIKGFFLSNFQSFSLSSLQLPQIPQLLLNFLISLNLIRPLFRFHCLINLLSISLCINIISTLDSFLFAFYQLE